MLICVYFFFKDNETTQIYPYVHPLSLPDALPISAGYAACFHSALRLVARQADIDVTDSAVSATVHLGSTEGGGFGIAVELDVSLPQASPDDAQRAVDMAHQVCPYANATRDNIKVDLRVA